MGTCILVLSRFVLPHVFIQPGLDPKCGLKDPKSIGWRGPPACSNLTPHAHELLSQQLAQNHCEDGERGGLRCIYFLPHSFHASLGLEQAIYRSKRYVEAGAQAIFPEACTDVTQYRAFYDGLDRCIPLLANLTEFGKTPTTPRAQLMGMGIAFALYPLSMFRAANRAAEQALLKILADDQAAALPSIQTRAELYDYLEYPFYDDLMTRMQAPATTQQPS